MNRRGFIGTMAAGSVGMTLPISPVHRTEEGLTPVPASATEGPGWQRLHPDAQTDLRGVEYFFLGNGRIAVAVQHATGEALEKDMTPLGLLLWDPHNFSRKVSTFTFHPEWGLRRGQISVRVGEETWATDAASLEVERRYEDHIPTVVASWNAGGHRVEERYWVPADEGVLFREVRFYNGGSGPAEVTFVSSLYYTHLLFTDYVTDHGTGTLKAEGYARMQLETVPHATLANRFLSVNAGTAAPGDDVSAVFVYRIGAPFGMATAGAARQRTSSYFRARAALDTPEPALNHLYLAARDGLRSAVAHSGRFDASIWQYNMEWVIDATGVIMACCHTGQFDVAAAVLDNVLTRLVNEKGICAHASRFHDDTETELNQQGALLGAAWTYWAWSADMGLIRRHWDTLRRVADFPLSPRYLHESGLIMAEIELFERASSAGVLPGFEIAHQAHVAWGLEKAADLARRVGDAASAERWSVAGRRMREAMLGHPQLALVEDDVLIKRRLPDGRRQRVLVPTAVGTDLIPEGSPLAREAERLLDPDMGLLYPILLGQVPVSSALARNTLASVKTLWNEDGGGYLRYHPSSDPDAPGGWTFPTAITGRALAMAGDDVAVRRVFDWLTSVQGSRGGAFFEIYAREPRPVPPLPPMGIIVWGWAEIANLFIEGLAGARPTPSGDSLVFDPHLPAGLDTLEAELPYREARIHVTIHRTGRSRASLDGRSLRRSADGFVLPAPLRSGNLQIEL
jgi:hypothetical protein